MEQINTRVVAVLCALFLMQVPFALAAQAEDTESDEYTAEDAADILPSAADEYDAEDGAAGKKAKASAWNNPRKQGVMKLIYGNGRYIEYDESKVYTSNPVGGLVLQKAKIIVNPKNGDAGLQTKFQVSTYAVLFNEQTRHRIFSAVDQYLKDFEEKKLKRKNGKSYVAYGRSTAYINYGTLAVMMAAEGEPKIQIGYKFKGKSPYFTITVRSAPNIDPNKGYNDVKDSTEFILYFTKAQATAMCQMLSDENVQQVLFQDAEDNGTIDKRGNRKPIGDEYEE